jgi:hypothetical protein
MVTVPSRVLANYFAGSHRCQPKDQDAATTAAEPPLAQRSAGFFASKDVVWRLRSRAPTFKDLICRKTVCESRIESSSRNLSEHHDTRFVADVGRLCLVPEKIACGYADPTDRWRCVEAELRRQRDPCQRRTR